MRARPEGWRPCPGAAAAAAAAAASLGLPLLAPETVIQVLFSGTAPEPRVPRPKMLSNAEDSQKAISFLLPGLLQGTPAWERLASSQPSALGKIQTGGREAFRLPPGAGGAGLQRSGGTCGRAVAPVARGAVSWKGSRYQSCLNSASSVPLRRVKDGVLRHGDPFALRRVGGCLVRAPDRKFGTF